MLDNLSKSTKNRILFSCLLALCIGNLMQNVVESFLPSFINSDLKEWKDNVRPSDTEGALIISVYSLAQIFFAPLNALIKNKMGSKNTILLGLGLMALTTFGLGFASTLDDADSFKSIAVALRFFQG